MFFLFRCKVTKYRCFSLFERRKKMYAIFARDVRHLARVSARSRAKTEPIPGGVYAISLGGVCGVRPAFCPADGLRRDKKAEIWKNIIICKFVYG